MESDPSVTTDDYFTSFTLTDGNLAIKSMQSPEEMSFTGGTLAVETVTGNFQVNGSTLEIYGNLGAAIDGYSVTDIQSGAGLNVSQTGTMTVSGNYVQTAGNLVLDYNGSAAFDKLTASNINLSNTTIKVKTSLDTVFQDQANVSPGFFDGSVTIGQNVSVISNPGWNWEFDATSGKLVNKTTFINNPRNIVSGNYVLNSGQNNNKGGNYNITGGELVIENLYMGGGGTGGSIVNQSGGTVIHNGKVFYLVMDEGSDTNSSTAWNMSGSARFYGINEEDSQCVIVGKNKNKPTQFNIGAAGETDSDVIFHVGMIKLGNTWQTDNGCGIMNVNNGEAYINQLQLLIRANQGDLTPSTLNVNGGKTFINTLESYHTGNLAADIQPEVNLKGGEIAIGNSNLSLNNQGSTVQIMGELDTLSDFLYLADNDESTIKPTGMSNIGTMTVQGDFSQSAGAIVFDVKSASEFDILEVTGDLLLTDGNLFINLLDGFLPEEGDAFKFLDVEGTLDVSGASLDILNGQYVFSNAAQTMFWLSNGDGTFAYAGTEKPVPEPATCVLLFLGAVGLAYFRKRR